MPYGQHMWKCEMTERSKWEFFEEIEQKDDKKEEKMGDVKG